MIKLTIEGREYLAPADWSELTLKKFIKIASIEIPKKLVSLYTASAALSDPDPANKEQNELQYTAASEALTNWDLVKRLPVYYGKVMNALCDIPLSVVNRIHHDPRTAFFDQYARYIVLSTFYASPVIIDPDKGIIPYETPRLESFDLHNQTFFLPRALHVMGEEIPLGSERVITFAEAADMEVSLTQMSEGSAESIPMFCAVYCRPEGEDYNEEKMLKRAELFKDLTMDKVWAVFFCTAVLYEKYMNSTRDYLKGVARLLRGSTQEAGSKTSDGGGLYTKWRKMEPTEQ